MTRTPGDSTPRDPRFDAAWRNASNEEPPPDLDAAIRAAARREVGAKPQSLAAHAATRSRHRWWPLAAAATVAVIAIGVVQRAGHDDLVVSPSSDAIVSDMPAQSAKSAKSDVPAQAARPEVTVQSVKPQVTAQSSTSNADAPTPSAPAEPRSRADVSAQSQAARNTQPAARADAQRSTPPSVAASSERKKESVASAPAPLPQPFPAAASIGVPATERDATNRMTAPAAAGGVAGGAPNDSLAERSTAVAPVQREESAANAQRQEPAASPKLAAPSTPTPAMSPAPSSAPSAQLPISPPASFAEGTRTTRPATMRASPLAKTAPAGAAADDSRIKDRAPLPVADWIALIRRLRSEGNSDEAARELAAFRAAHTDHEKLLPPDLRDWHPTDK